MRHEAITISLTSQDAVSRSANILAEEDLEAAKEMFEQTAQTEASEHSPMLHWEF